MSSIKSHLESERVGNESECGRDGGNISIKDIKESIEKRRISVKDLGKNRKSEMLVKL
jgi:hypothetical protein